MLSILPNNVFYLGLVEYSKEQEVARWGKEIETQCDKISKPTLALLLF